jgi:hypothetical protein
MNVQANRSVRLRAGLVGVALLLAAALPRGQGVAPPTGRDIVARYVAAIGGEEAYRAIKSIRARGKFELPAQQIVGTIELLSARPAKLLWRATIPGIGMIETGYNGKVGWSIDPLAGPTVFSGRQLSELADDAWFDGTLHGPDHLRELTTVGREDFDRRPAWKVHVVTISGSEQFEYFDVDTGLQIGVEATRQSPLGIAPMTSILRDYQRFGALLQPASVIQRTLGLEQAVTISSIEYDTVPEDAFDLPAEIKALIKQGPR